MDMPVSVVVTVPLAVHCICLFPASKVTGSCVKAQVSLSVKVVLWGTFAAKIWPTRDFIYGFYTLRRKGRRERQQQQRGSSVL